MRVLTRIIIRTPPLTVNMWSRSSKGLESPLPPRSSRRLIRSITRQTLLTWCFHCASVNEIGFPRASTSHHNVYTALLSVQYLYITYGMWEELTHQVVVEAGVEEALEGMLASLQPDDRKERELVTRTLAALMPDGWRGIDHGLQNEVQIQYATPHKKLLFGERRTA